MIASDVSDNVRRNAVIALGFIYVNKPDDFTPTALLLLQSYNPHIRYASALIAGFINAGSANKQLAESMMKLMDDSVNDEIMLFYFIGRFCYPRSSHGSWFIVHGM